MILRPQDLKSIKTAVGRGSRAAASAIEVIEEASEDADQIAEGQDYDQRDTAGQGAVGNGFFLVTKTEELEPPKGIVNAAQLEMELTRVFANAIMFNPLPQTERSFGRNLRLRKHGGDVPSREEEDNTEADAENEDDKSEETAPSEESEDADSADTGIINDSREMFEDVRKQVEAWRELEEERQKLKSTSAEGLPKRHESVVSAEDNSTPVPSKEKEEEGRGTLRKRRKLAAD